MTTQTDFTSIDFSKRCISCQSPHVVLKAGDKVLWERNTGRSMRNPHFRIKSTVIKELPSRKVKIAARFKGEDGRIVEEQRTVDRWKLYRFDWQETAKPTEPDTAAMSEGEFMEYTLHQLRIGKQKPIVTMSQDELEAIGHFG